MQMLVVLSMINLVKKNSTIFFNCYHGVRDEYPNTMFYNELINI